MFKLQFMLQQRCDPCSVAPFFNKKKLSHIVIPLVALCYKQAVAICNNTCRIL